MRKLAAIAGGVLLVLYGGCASYPEIYKPPLGHETERAGLATVGVGIGISFVDGRITFTREESRTKTQLPSNVDLAPGSHVVTFGCVTPWGDAQNIEVLVICEAGKRYLAEKHMKGYRLEVTVREAGPLNDKREFDP